jgi:hypothetical protein
MLFKKPGMNSLVIRDLDGKLLSVIDEEENPLLKF